MKDSLNGTWVIRDSAQGKGMCHRAQFLVIPQSLGKLVVSRPPCTGASCALWDSELKLCLDVVNANTLLRIARTLTRLEDRLPPELP